MPFLATWMKTEIVRLREVSQTEKEKYDKYDIPSMWNLKRSGTNELIYKTEPDSKIQRI